MAYGLGPGGGGAGDRWMIEVEDGELTQELQQNGIDLAANRETRLVVAAELQRTTGRPYFTIPIRQMNIPSVANLHRSSATSPPAPATCKVFRELTDEELRDGLRAAGVTVGPITHTTRKLYIDRYRKHYRGRRIVQSSCCTQSVSLNANPVLPPIGDRLPAHQQLVPIPDLLAGLNAVPPASPSPPPPPYPQGEYQGRLMHDSPDHFSPPILSLPVAGGRANADATPSRPHPHIPPQVGPLFTRQVPLTGAAPQKPSSTTHEQPHLPPATGKHDKGMSTDFLDSAATGTAVNAATNNSTQCSPGAVQVCEGQVQRGGQSTSVQTSRLLGATTSNGKLKSTAEGGAASCNGASKEDKKETSLSSAKCKKVEDGVRQPASDLPSRSSQPSPSQQLLSQFQQLSTSGTHMASDVCFVLQNGDTLFASRGFLAAACPVMLPLLYNSEAPFPVVVNSFNGHSRTVWTRANETITDIKLKLSMQVGVPAEQQRLVFQGQDLEEVQTVAASGVVQHSTLHLVLRHAPPAGRGAVQLVGEAAHSTLSIQRLSLGAAGGCDALHSSLQATARRSQATPTAHQATPTSHQATPTSHQSTPSHSSLLAPVEVVLPLYISHIVLCEGIGTRALDQVISFLYSGSVDISEDVAVQMCILAEKFQISKLIDLTLPVVRRTLHQDTLLLPLLVSFSGHLLRLQSVCLDFLLLPGNEDVLQYVFTMLSGDPEMLQQVQCAVEMAKED